MAEKEDFLSEIENDLTLTENIERQGTLDDEAKLPENVLAQMIENIDKNALNLENPPLEMDTTLDAKNYPNPEDVLNPETGDINLASPEMEQRFAEREDALSAALAAEGQATLNRLLDEDEIDSVDVAVEDNSPEVVNAETTLAKLDAADVAETAEMDAMDDLTDYLEPLPQEALAKDDIEVDVSAFVVDDELPVDNDLSAAMKEISQAQGLADDDIVDVDVSTLIEEDHLPIDEELTAELQAITEDPRVIRAMEDIAAHEPTGDDIAIPSSSVGHTIPEATPELEDDEVSPSRDSGFAR